MRKGMRFGTIGVVSLLILATVSDRAEAIPALARKYKTACITCHATFPRLTALGEAIRLNGYKMPGGDELYVKDQPVSMGAEAYKQVFPNAVWPSDIPGMPPISLRIVTDYDFNVGGSKASSTDFRIDEAALLAAGSFGEDMSFFVEVEYEESELELDVETAPVGVGGETVVTDVGVEDHESGTEFAAWLMWEDLFKKTVGENHLNLRFGSIGMQDRALPNTRGHNRITVADYLYMTELMLHGHGNSIVGVEANGFGKQWRYNVGIQNGDGATSKKNYYAAASLKFGGLGYDGSGGTTEEGGLKTSPSGYWRDDSILIGGFYYVSYSGDQDFKFDRIGADARGNYKDLSVALGFITGDNDATNENKDIWFAEAEYFVFPWLQPYLRYETLSSDVSNGDQSRFVVGTVLLARANVKFNVEGVFYSKNEPIEAVTGDKNDEDLVVVRLDYAF